MAASLELLVDLLDLILEFLDRVLELVLTIVLNHFNGHHTVWHSLNLDLGLLEVGVSCLNLHLLLEFLVRSLTSLEGRLLVAPTSTTLHLL